MRNARFWVYYNGGFVKLTLTPNQSVSLQSGGATDEGFSCSAETWTHCGDYVEWSLAQWGRDCDGRHEWGADYECDIMALSSYGDNVVPLPDWKKEGSGQRDYTAESMGY